MYPDAGAVADGFPFFRVFHGGGPAEEPFGFFGAHIDAAVTHGRAPVAMPVGSVQRIALVEVHDPGHTGQIVAGAGHILRIVFQIHFVVALHGGEGGG